MRSQVKRHASESMTEIVGLHYRAQCVNGEIPQQLAGQILCLVIIWRIRIYGLPWNFGPQQEGRTQNH
jgi:hypothetical protein